MQEKKSSIVRFLAIFSHFSEMNGNREKNMVS